MKRELDSDEGCEPALKMSKIPQVVVKSEEMEELHSPTTSAESSPLAKTSPQFMEITCGALSGVLHTERFICPGIRERCIETTDAPGILLTPVEFTIKAEKNRQKDWKGAIKHNGRMLRTLMEFKQLDFYNHAVTCSYKCHSRNYITSKNSTTSPVPKPPKMPKNSSPNLVLSNGLTNQLLHGQIMKNPELMALLSAHFNAENSKRQDVARMKIEEKQMAIRSLIRDDPSAFWAQTIQSKLTNLMLNSVTRELGLLAHNLNHGRDFDESARKLSQVLEVLGISESAPAELCGQFILPVKVEIPVELVVEEPEEGGGQNSSSEPAPNLPNLNNNLSSKEQLELMLQNIQG